MKQRPLALINLFMPSVGGFATYIVLALITFTVFHMSGIHPYLISLLSLHLASDFIQFLTQVLAHLFGSYASTVIVAIFWGFVGLCVYVVVIGATDAVRDVDWAVVERHFTWPAGSDPNRPLEELLTHTLFRTAAAILLLVYIVFFESILRDYFEAHYPSLQNLLSLQGLGALALAMLIEIAVLHGAVILLRLVTMRRRLIFSIN